MSLIEWIFAGISAFIVVVVISAIWDAVTDWKALIAQIYESFNGTDAFVLFAVAMLAIGISGAAYPFYSTLRWVVFGCSIWLAYCCIRTRLYLWLTTYVFIAATFNPFAEVYLGRGYWLWADIIAIVCIAAGWLVSRIPQDKDRPAFSVARRAFALEAQAWRNARVQREKDRERAKYFKKKK